MSTLTLLDSRASEWLSSDGAARVRAFRDAGSSDRDSTLRALFDGARDVQDPEVRQALANEFWRAIFMRLSQINHGAAVDDDALQSAALALWIQEKELEFRGEAQFLSYLSRRMSWKLSAYRRRASRAVADSNEGVMAEGSGPATWTMLTVDARDLLTRVKGLPDREQYLILARIQGLDLAEQSEHLGISREACRRAGQRALIRLRTREPRE